MLTLISFEKGLKDSEKELLKTVIYEATFENKTALKRYEDLYGKELDINILFKTRMRSRAGFYKASKDLIAINARLHLENLDELKSTFLHELAHKIEREIHGKTNHGKRFKEIATEIGDPQKGKTCHSMNTKSIKKKNVYKRFLYGCGCGDIFKLSSIIHNRIEKGRGRYCLKCKETVKFVRPL